MLFNSTYLLQTNVQVDDPTANSNVATAIYLNLFINHIKDFKLLSGNARKLCTLKRRML